MYNDVCNALIIFPWNFLIKKILNVFRILEFGKISVYGHFTFSWCCQKGQETKEGDRGKHIWRKKSVQPPEIPNLLWWPTLGKTVFLCLFRRMYGRAWLCCNMPELIRNFAKNSMVWVNVRFSVLAGSTADVVWAYQLLCYHVLVKPSQIFHTCVSSTFQFWNVAIFSRITYFLVEL